MSRFMRVYLPHPRISIQEQRILLFTTILFCLVAGLFLLFTSPYSPTLIFSFIHAIGNSNNTSSHQRELRSIDSQNHASNKIHDFKSSKRGHIAILYSGTVRAFTLVFHSHLINLIIPSPYHVHIFMHASSGRFDWKTPSQEHPHTQIYRGFNATIEYFNSYLNIDNELVSLMNDVVKYVEITDNPLDMNIDSYFNYTEIFRLIGKRHDGESKPASVAGQLDSLRRANQARLNYENTNGIKYQWIIRLRMDHLMKTNIWEDLFSIEPLNISNINHRKLFNESLIYKTKPISNSSNSYWNGGLLYDMVYIPRQDSNLSSTDHDKSLFVPTCEWWYGVTDQFAIGGSIAMTKYSERFNAPLIANLAKNPRWKLWAEPLVKELIDYEKLPVYKLRHVYNIIRVIHTNRSLHENTFTASRCIYIWYGRYCHRDHCPYWIHQFNLKQALMLNRSQQNREILLRDEVYANSGHIAKESFHHYMVYVNSIYHQLLQSQIDSNFSLMGKSNFYYFWRYRSPKHMLQCVMPVPHVDPVRAMTNPPSPLPIFKLFDIFAYQFYPFIMLTTDPEKHQRYKQSSVCNLE